MLNFIRKATKTTVGKIVGGVLFGFLIISFAIWGISDVFTTRISNAVATIDGKDVTPQDYKSAFDRLVRQASEQAQRPVTAEEARAAGLGDQALERLVGERSLNALAAALGVAASDETIAREIRNIPAFRSSITGQFDKTQYETVLQQNELTVAGFERDIRGEFVRRKLLVAAALGVSAPPALGELALGYATERRAISFFPVDPNLLGPPPVPTEAQLKAFYEENKANLMMPERRSVTLVIARPTDFAAKVVVDEAKVRQLFDFRKKDLSQPATRSFVQIVAPDRAKAEAAAARLKAGETPEAIAKALGLAAPLTFADAAQETVPDEKIGTAVFGATVGAVVGPIQGSLNWAAAKVTGSKAGSEPTFESQAAALREQVAKDETNGLMSLATENFEDAVAKGGELEKSAAAAGLQVIKIANIDNSGTDIDGQTDATLLGAPDLLKTAFSTGLGETSDLAAIPDDGYAAVRVDTIKAAAPRPYAEVLDELRRAWISREVVNRVQAKAKELAASAGTAGNSLEKVAASVKRPVDKIGLLLRGQTNVVVSQELGAELFKAAKGGVVAGPSSNNAVYVVARVDSIERDPPKARPDRLAQAQDAMKQSISEDLASTLERAARTRFKARTFPDQARQAIGGPADAASSAAPPAKS
jgi:peptidyl-prolyl cis-trans isomerase D